MWSHFTKFNENAAKCNIFKWLRGFSWLIMGFWGVTMHPCTVGAGRYRLAEKLIKKKGFHFLLVEQVHAFLYAAKTQRYSRRL